MIATTRVFIAILLLICTNVAAAEPVAPQTQTVDQGWYTIVMPQLATVGEPTTFIVTFTKIPDTAIKAHMDLHWLTTTGENKGVNRVGSSKDIILNKPMEWVITPVAKDGIGKILPVLYVTTDGKIGRAHV